MRTLTLNRPEALNAQRSLYDSTRRVALVPRHVTGR
ncbi:enoyl-CoA hydratase/isomerase family protein [Mycobacterium interjectum]|nr:enoyl-CoA hydratase/isomerase family protein [Mycobacterium interjectum]